MNRTHPKSFSQRFMLMPSVSFPSPKSNSSSINSSINCNGEGGGGGAGGSKFARTPAHQNPQNRDKFLDMNDANPANFSIKEPATFVSAFVMPLNFM